MKERVVIFIGTIVLLLMIVPVLNIAYAPNLRKISFIDRNFLYNTDIIVRWAGKMLCLMGISTDPQQVIVGHSGWLYLGDKYDQILTAGRRTPLETDFFLCEEIRQAIEAWDVTLASKGVKLFRVMIGPNKSSIYPEYMPTWARPVAPNVTDTLLSGSHNFIDPRKALLLAKQRYNAPLYYKTDTHWNFLGAAVAFQEFSLQVGNQEPEIKWPDKNAYQIREMALRGGGDLANFLRLSHDISEFEPILESTQNLSVVTQTNFDTQEVLPHGGPPSLPVLVKSKGALNNKKVLWLRDSFGGALLPLMSTTFSQILQIHWSEALKKDGRFLEFVDTWKPDYVFITVVERSAKNEIFIIKP